MPYNLKTIQLIKDNIMNNLPDSPFDDVPKLYEETLNWSYRKYLEIPTIKALLGDLSGLNVLDYGCGPGVLSRQFKEMGASKVTGYDISKGMLDYAQQLEKNSPLNIDYVSHISPDKYQTFDVIIAIYPLVCVSDYDEVSTIIKQFGQLLKPNGKLINVLLNTEMSHVAEYYTPYGFSIRDIGPRHNGSIAHITINNPLYNLSLPMYYWYMEKLLPLFKDANFDDIKKIELTAPPSEHLSELTNYIECPHVNIFYAHKK